MSKTSRFAGLMGFGAKKAEDKKDKDMDAKAEKPVQKEDESDEDFEKRLKEWEDAQDDGESAETPKDTTDDSENQPDDKKGKKALKDATDAARAEGHAAGAAAERARWDGVLASAAAKGKPISAMCLLADTDMNAAAIQKALAAMPVESTRTTLADRHQTPTPAPAPDAPAAETGKGKFAARVTEAVERIHGKKAA